MNLRITKNFMVYRYEIYYSINEFVINCAAEKFIEVNQLKIIQIGQENYF